MSFSIGAFANGLAGATDRIVLQQKEAAQLKRQQEEQEYNRKRQAVADEQAAQLHDQNVQKNEILLNNGLREQAEQQRTDELKSRIGVLQRYKASGDTKGAFDTSIATMNKDNETNPSWNQDHTISYYIDPENPNMATLNIVDKKTGNMVKQINQYANTDTLIDMIYSQIDPVGAYESATAGKAKLAEETRKNDFELKKLGVQSDYKLDELTHKGKIDQILQDGKFQNNYTLEGIRQQGANYREQVKQDNENYRSDSKISADPKVVQQAGGALGYARSNLDQFKNLSVDTIFNHLMQQESAGNHIDKRTGQMTRSPKGALGIAQIMPDTAKQIYQETGIDVYSSAEANIAGGKYYLNKMLQLNNGDMTKALAAYNAGNGRLKQGIARATKAGHPERWLDYMPPETRDYVPKILGKMINASNTIQTQNRGNYAVATSGKATDSIKTVSANMTSELGYEGKNNAAVIGGLSGLQPKIVKFTSDPTYKGRFDAYQDILTLVQRVVDRSPMRANMSVQERNEYVHQKAAEMIGAKDKIEVGQWIQQGSRPQPKQQAAAAPSVDFSQFSIGDTKPTTTAKQTASAPPKYLTTVPNNAPKPSNQTKVVNNPFSQTQPLPRYFNQTLATQNNAEKLKSVLNNQ
ncbi:lytic transglycosylase domain-containing protein [Acinetobacter sp. CFCC 10889]|uniref:lytic transglycosylase domain-containing protein n=1 Tax=Acinetobacter sp. CFCC 10889 TaxID=1775557 RepID=UPI000DD0CCED|nr:lytic transglycosylase domain-containing protein [Acinetobacter sp. CFCC 10889]